MEIIDIMGYQSEAKSVSVTPIFLGFPETSAVDRSSIQSSSQSKYNYMVPMDQQRFQ